MTETLSPTTPSSPDRRRALLAWTLLARTTHKIGQTLAEGLRAHGLSPAQLEVLAQVSHHEGLTQQELADRLLVTKGNVCQLLGRMETSGLLERRPVGSANHLFLTPLGHELYARVMPEHETLIATLLSALPPDGQRSLIAELRQIDGSLGEAPSCQPEL